MDSAISQSSTAIMIDVLIGKTIKEAKDIVETFIKMIRREITRRKRVGEKLRRSAIAFKNIANMPARVKCALLAWHTLEELLENNGK